jgi:hypothetical protein
VRSERSHADAPEREHGARLDRRTALRLPTPCNESNHPTTTIEVKAQRIVARFDSVRLCDER